MLGRTYCEQVMETRTRSIIKVFHLGIFPVVTILLGNATLFSPATVQAQLTEGKKVSLVDWEHFTKMQTYMGKAFEAYGFPKVEK